MFNPESLYNMDFAERVQNDTLEQDRAAAMELSAADEARRQIQQEMSLMGRPYEYDDSKLMQADRSNFLTAQKEFQDKAPSPEAYKEHVR